MKRSSVNNYTVRTTPTHSPGFCEGGSRSPPRLDPHLNDGTLSASHPQTAIQSPHMHVPRRVDLHLPSPAVAITGLDKSDAFSQHRSLPAGSTAAPSQWVQKGENPITFTLRHAAAILLRPLCRLDCRALADWPGRSRGAGPARRAARRSAKQVGAGLLRHPPRGQGRPGQGPGRESLHPGKNSE